MILIADLHEEARLIEVCHSLIVSLLEVAGKFGGNVIPDELVLSRSHLKVDISHDVGPLVAPICDD